MPYKNPRVIIACRSLAARVTACLQQVKLVPGLLFASSILSILARFGGRSASLAFSPRPSLAGLCSIVHILLGRADAVEDECARGLGGDRAELRSIVASPVPLRHSLYRRLAASEERTPLAGISFQQLTVTL